MDDVDLRQPRRVWERISERFARRGDIAVTGKECFVACLRPEQRDPIEQDACE